jgi:hypothetical protein
MRVDPNRLKVTAAQVVWPKKQKLEIARQDGRVRVILEDPARYTAVLLKV